MIPLKDKYYSNDKDILKLVTDLKYLIEKYYLNEKTIDLLAGFNEGCISNFLNLKDGLTYEQSTKIYSVIFNLTKTFENIYSYNNCKK